MYEPQNSLPFQYKALDRIQDIKNSARIYVHRIGFDPPPIKEDRRLTGDFKSVAPKKIQEVYEYEHICPGIREAISVLTFLLESGEQAKPHHRTIFSAAGTELATLAIDRPGHYLGLLQQLKNLEEGGEQAPLDYTEVLKGLLRAVPETADVPFPDTKAGNLLQDSFLKSLSAYD